MKCPKCGHWNKSTFPRCFQCGEPLNAEEARPADWQGQFDRPSKKPQIRVVYDDSTPPETNVDIDTEEEPQTAESLAQEMNRLKDRRARGTVYLEEFRKNAAEQGITPTGTGVSIRRGGGFFDEVPDDPEATVYEPPEIRERRRASSRTRRANTGSGQSGRGKSTKASGMLSASEPYEFADSDLPPALDAPAALLPEKRAQKRRRRRLRGPVLLAVWFVRVLALAAVGVLIWQGTLLIQARTTGDAASGTVPDYTIETIDVDGQPGRRVQIYADEGARVYIRELMKSYVVVGGVATIEVADHVFYDTISPLEISQMEVSLTPTVSRNGVETHLSSIKYTIDIPLSPLELIQPEADYVAVSTSIYNLQIRVQPGSVKVMINGRDVKDAVDQNGIVTDNPPIQAIGENYVTISVQAPYCRENNKTITIYRAPQEISLDLAPDTRVITSEEAMTIHATTMVGATVSIDSPFYTLDDSDVGKTGKFSFQARMVNVGYNTIRIRASYPDKEDSILEHTVYYLPSEAEYTKKAWALNASDYQELLNNIAFRAEKAQIYLCKGVVTRILASNPQLVIMDTGKDGKEQLVMIENRSSNLGEPMELDGEYRVFADVSGLYDAMPKLIGRYAYTPTPAPTASVEAPASTAPPTGGGS